MRRLVGAVVGFVLAWLLGVGGAAFALTPPPGLHPYAYDTHTAPIAVAADSLERGPPTKPYDDAATLAAGEQPNRMWAHPEVAASHAYATFDAPMSVARVDSSTGTTREPAQAIDRDCRGVGPAGVAANTAAKVCANSFTGETLILMADGTKKPIKDVKLGDRVIATDPETGKTGPRKVVDLIRHGGWHTMVAVRLSDGTTIDATDQHPFWVESRGEWVDAIDLEPGELLVTADGDRLTVTSLGISEQDLTAYNLTVAGLHTYYVGDEAVLVHNAVCPTAFGERRMD